VAKGRIELPTVVLDINKAFTKNIKVYKPKNNFLEIKIFEVEKYY
tara:strand:- start:942 stop:1076 length:135 start_codon:yes stop_codon:yes gene_type:complete